MVAVGSSAMAGVVKSLALDHLANLDRIIVQDEKTLAEIKQPGANATLLIRDQNRRYMDMAARTGATFGENPRPGSNEERCSLIFQNAQFVWQAKLELARNPSNFNRDALTNYRRLYQGTRSECEKFIKGQKG